MNLNKDPEQRQKLKALIARLVVGKRWLAETPPKDIPSHLPDFIEQSAAVLAQLGANYEGVEALEAAFLDFDLYYSEYFNLSALGAENEASLREQAPELQQWVSLFAPHLNLREREILGNYALNFATVEAKASFQEWFRRQPSLSLRDLHADAASRGLVEQAIRGQLPKRYWLEDRDIRLALADAGVADQVSVLPLNVADIGFALHQQRLAKADGAEPYTAHFIVNLGSGGLESRGVHWARVKVEVDPSSNNIRVDYYDSLQLSVAQRADLTRKLVAAVHYQEEIRVIGEQTRKFKAFPHAEVTVECTGTGEQRDEWSCGYRALAGVVQELAPGTALGGLHAPDAASLRDEVYKSVLRQAKVSSGVMRAIGSASALVESAEASSEVTTFKAETVDALIATLSLPTVAKASEAVVDLAAQSVLAKLVRELTAKEDFNSFKAPHDVVTLDFQTLLKLIPADAEQEQGQAALVTALMFLLRHNKSGVSLTILNSSLLTEGARHLLAQLLDANPYVTHFESDLFVTSSVEVLESIPFVQDLTNLDVLGKSIAARNQFLNETLGSKLDREEEGDFWAKAVYVWRTKASSADTVSLHIPVDPDRSVEINKLNLLIEKMRTQFLVHLFQQFELHHAEPYWQDIFRQFKFEGSIVRDYQFSDDEEDSEQVKFNDKGFFDFLSKCLTKFPINRLTVALEPSSEGADEFFEQFLRFYEKAELSEVVLLSLSVGPGKTLTDSQFKKLIEVTERKNLRTRLVTRTNNRLLSFDQELELGLLVEQIERKLEAAKFEPSTDSTVAKAVKKSPADFQGPRPAKTSAAEALAALQAQVQIQAQSEVQEQQQMQMQSKLQRSFVKQGAGASLRYPVIASEGLKKVGDQVAPLLGISSDKLPFHIAYLSEEAHLNLTKYSSIFAGAINWDNPPEGFYLMVTEEAQGVLCFDANFAPENLNESSLTVHLLSKRIKADVKQAMLMLRFMKDPSKTYLAEFYQLMFEQDPEESEKIKRKYDHLLGELINRDDLFSFLAPAVLVVSRGLGGLERLLNFSAHLKNKDRAVFDIFKDKFLVSKVVTAQAGNWLQLATPEVLTEIEKLLKLDANALRWWALLMRSVPQDEGFHWKLLEWIEPFNYFVAEYKKLCEGTGITKLPEIFPLDQRGLVGELNMQIILDRWLRIFKNAANFAEQVACLNGSGQEPSYLSVAADGPFYASVYCSFTLVTPEMQLRPGHPEGYGYEITYAQLTAGSQTDALSLEDFKVLYYRHLAKVQYRYPFPEYVRAVEVLEKKFSGKESPEFIKLKKQLLSLFILSSTHEDVYSANPIAQFETFMDELLELSGAERAKALQVFERIVCWTNDSVYPNFSAIRGLYIALMREDDAELAMGRLNAEILLAPERWLSAVSLSASHPDSSLALSESVDFMVAVRARFPLPADKGVVDEFISIIALLNREAYTAADRDALLSFAVTMDKTKLQEILAMLAKINPDPAKSSVLLTVKNMSDLLTHLNTQDLKDYRDRQQAIIKCLQSYGVTCVFDASIQPMAAPLDLQEMLQANLEGLISGARQIGIALDSAAMKGPDWLAYLRKTFEGAKSNLLIRGALQAVEGLIRLKVTEYYDSITQFAMEKIADGNKELMAGLSTLISSLNRNSKIQGDLFEFLVALSDNNKQLESFMTSLKKTQAIWPADFSSIVLTLANSIPQSNMTASLLSKVMHQFNEAFRRSKLPLTVLSTVLTHALFNEKYLNDPTRDAPILSLLAIILKQEKLSADQKSSLIRVVFDTALTDMMGAKALLEILVRDEANLSSIISIAAAHTRAENPVGELSRLIPAIRLASRIAEAQTEDPELQKQIKILSIFNTKLARKPELYVNLVTRILGGEPVVVAPAEAAITESVLIPDAEPHVVRQAAIPRLSEKQHLIFELIAFGLTDHVTQDVLNELITQLKLKAEPELQILVTLYQKNPHPSLGDLLNELARPKFKNLAEFVVAKEKEPFGPRTTVIQFDASVAQRAVAEIENLDGPVPAALSLMDRRQLGDWFRFVNAIGNNETIFEYQDEKFQDEKLVQLAAKDLSRQQMIKLRDLYAKIITDPKASKTDITKARLCYLALLREAMYRTTGKIPNSTQMIALLSNLQRGGNVISEISTGQGKGLITAMTAAMLWVEGITVDVCTSNSALAKRDLEEHLDFFDYLNIPHSSSSITASSDTRDYVHQGINYSDVAQLALFRERELIEGKIKPDAEASLVLDEADFSILDDSTLYRYARNIEGFGDKNDYAWIYPFINGFIETDDFNDPEAMRFDDVTHLREYVARQGLNAHQERLLARLTDKQLDVWIDSALAAKQLKEGVHFVVRAEDFTEAGETRQISVARLIIHNRVSADAQWSNGVQQLLHARLNQEVAAGVKQRPLFLIEPELAPVASMDSKGFLDGYRRSPKSKIWGLTGTAGAVAERVEQAEKFGFSMRRIPTHQAQARKDHEALLAADDAEHKRLIMSQIKQRLRKGQSWLGRSPTNPQPILVICKNAEAAAELHRYISVQLATDRGLRHEIQLYNGLDQHQSEESVVTAAGRPGMITVTTDMLGRGTDIKIQKTAQGNEPHPDGLFVLQTYVDIERASRQVMGRAGRQGQAGETRLVATRAELGISPVPRAAKESLIADKQARLLARGRVDRQFRNSYSQIQSVFFTRFLDALTVLPEGHSSRRVLLGQWAQLLEKLAQKWQQISLEEKAKQEVGDPLETSLLQFKEFALKEWNSFAVEIDGKLAEITVASSAVASASETKTFVLAVEALELVIPPVERRLSEDALPFLEAQASAMEQPISWLVADYDPMSLLDRQSNFERSEALKMEMMDRTRQEGLPRIAKQLEELKLSSRLGATDMLKQILYDLYAQLPNKGAKADKKRMAKLCVAYRDLMKMASYNEGLLKIMMDLQNSYCAFESRTQVWKKSKFILFMNELVSTLKMDLGEASWDAYKATHKTDIWGNLNLQLKDMALEYSQQWGVSSDRLANVKDLIRDLAGCGSIESALQTINAASLAALTSDLAADQKSWVKRNRNGSRYQTLLMEMKTILVAMSPPNTLSQSLKALDGNDERKALSDRISQFKMYVEKRKLAPKNPGLLDELVLIESQLLNLDPVEKANYCGGLKAIKMRLEEFVARHPSLDFSSKNYFSWIGQQMDFILRVFKQSKTLEFAPAPIPTSASESELLAQPGLETVVVPGKPLSAAFGTESTESMESAVGRAGSEDGVSDEERGQGRTPFLDHR